MTARISAFFKFQICALVAGAALRTEVEAGMEVDTAVIAAFCAGAAITELTDGCDAAKHTLHITIKVNKADCFNRFPCMHLYPRLATNNQKTRLSIKRQSDEYYHDYRQDVYAVTFFY